MRIEKRAYAGDPEADVFSDGSDLDPLQEMKVVFDDASRVLPAEAVDALVEYVAQGCKLVLLAGSGERIHRGDENWPPLQARFQRLERPPPRGPVMSPGSDRTAGPPSLQVDR
jgi:hypothetical protein